MITLYNRYSQTLEKEKVYGSFWVNFLHRSRWGNLLLKIFATRGFSKFLGFINDLKISKYKIKSFIKKYNIDINEYCGEYQNFNQFFIRKFKDGKRPFSQDIPAFCEARYLGGNNLNGLIKVKESNFNLEGLLDHKHVNEFLNGPYLIARLAPVDYHYFHFVDDGEVLDSYPIRGEFHSVSPIAILRKPNILATNERFVTIINTQHFGKIAYIEVGALGVGKIVELHGNTFKKGEIKGHFLFGASTVIIVGQVGKWKVSTDILNNSKNLIETFVRLGDTVGLRSK